MATNNALDLSTAGIVSYNGTGTFNGVTLTGTANQIAISNGTGVAGVPTFSLTSNIYVNISFNSGTNILSAYSVGTFSPVFTTAGGGEAVTYTTQIGVFEKIGTQVIYNLMLQLATKTGGSGIGRISIPITSNATAITTIDTCGLQGCTFGTSQYWAGQIAANNTFLTIVGVQSTIALTNLNNTAITATATFKSSGIYNI